MDVDDRVATFLCFALLVLPLLDLEVEVGDEHNGDDREAEPEHRVLGREVERVDDHQRRTNSDNHPQKVSAFHVPRPISERKTHQESDCPSHCSKSPSRVRYTTRARRAQLIACIL